MNPECDDRVRVRVRLSKSDKNIAASSWWVDNLFEAADSGDVLSHPRITNVYIYIYTLTKIMMLNRQHDYCTGVP